MFWQLEFGERQVSKVLALLVKKVLIDEKLVCVSDHLIKKTWVDFLHDLTTGGELLWIEIYSLILFSELFILNLSFEINFVTISL